MAQQPGGEQRRADPGDDHFVDPGEEALAPRSILPGRALVALPSAITGDAVDQHVVHPDRELIRVLEGRLVRDLFRIEDDDVGPHARFEHAAIGQPHPLRRQRA